MKYLTFLFSLLICISAAQGIGQKAQGTRAFAEEGLKQKQTRQKPAPPQSITPRGTVGARGKGPAASRVEKTGSKSTSEIEGQRDPTKIPREIEAQMEEVEPPEIRVIGIMQVNGKKGKKGAATVELNLENFEGTVVLEPGMTVSMEKPNREQSESNRWMTYFTVRKINSFGIEIELENGEKVWLPVMGEKE